MKNVQNRVKEILEALKTADVNKKGLSDKLGLDYMDIFISLYMRDSIKNIKDWEQKEVDRQINKHLSNKIGDFHEIMVISFSGWERVKDFKQTNPDRYEIYKGLDVINEKKKIACEIKNKHNTTNTSSFESIVKRLDRFKKTKKWKAYFVIMLPKPQSVLALKGKEDKMVKVGKKDIKVNCISGAELYRLATGKKLFYRNLITKIFPQVLNLNSQDKKRIIELYDKVYKKNSK